MSIKKLPRKWYVVEWKDVGEEKETQMFVKRREARISYLYHSMFGTNEYTKITREKMKFSE